MSTPGTDDDLAATRLAWHRLAEHVLSPARHAATSRIGLRPGPGGFRTPPFGDDSRVLAVEGAEVVLLRGDHEERRVRPATLAQARRALGVTASAPQHLYEPTTSDDPSEPLRIDETEAAGLADWFRLGAEVLAVLAEDLAERGPGPAQLWPEHFDLAITAGALNLGFSCGDETSPVPYAYVGPHEPPPADGFWNAPFGAFRRRDEIPDQEAATAFLREGVRLLDGG